MKKKETIQIELVKREVSRVDFMLRSFFFWMTRFFVRVANA